jgi:hypothetical protein
MHSNLNQKLLFLGNRAAKISELMELKEKRISYSHLSFSASLPFSEEKNTLLIDSNLVPISCEYDYECLKTEFVRLIQNNQLNSSFQLIIGDPSEVLYQAFCCALLETQLYTQRSFHEIHLWLYPMGMTSLDIRKELAQFIYKLKKNDTQVLLLRKQNNEAIAILTSFITQIQTHSIYELEEDLDGLEFLIGKQSTHLING